jgi:hypothetical protein
MFVSYEGFMSLRETYLRDFYRQLEINSTKVPYFKDGNEKYVVAPTLEKEPTTFHERIKSLQWDILTDSNAKARVSPAAERPRTAHESTSTIHELRRRRAITLIGAMSFVEALPHDHSLEEIVLDEDGFDDYSSAVSIVLQHEHALEVIGYDGIRFVDFDRNLFVDDSVVSIVRTFCRTPLKVLSLAGSRGSNDIHPKCCIRIIQTLKENEHSFTKLDLFRDSQHSLWQNKIRLQIGKLTWNNRLQLEKDTWVAQFLQQDAPTQDLLFSAALERANKVDNEQFSKVPNMMFYLINELPYLIAQAICDEDYYYTSRSLDTPTVFLRYYPFDGNEL